MKRLNLFLLFLIALPVKNCAASPGVSDGCVGAKLGMTSDEVRAAIRRKALRIHRDQRGEITVRSKFFGCASELKYYFTPLTKRLYKVTVVSEDLTRYQSIREAMRKRFGGETSTRTSAVSHVSRWYWKKQDVSLFLSRTYNKGSYSRLVMNLIDHNLLLRCEAEKTKKNYDCKLNTRLGFINPAGGKSN